jgi:hypothetical protein
MLKQAFGDEAVSPQTHQRHKRLKEGQTSIEVCVQNELQYIFKKNENNQKVGKRFIPIVV